MKKKRIKPFHLKERFTKGKLLSRFRFNDGQIYFEHPGMGTFTLSFVELENQNLIGVRFLPNAELRAKVRNFNYDAETLNKITQIQQTLGAELNKIIANDGSPYSLDEIWLSCRDALAKAPLQTAR